MKGEGALRGDVLDDTVSKSFQNSKHMKSPLPAPQLLMFNKPKGCTVTRADELGQTNVYDLLPSWVKDEGWFPIGRLDKDSKGLLLFTKNGRISDRLTKPGAVEKVYEVWIRGWITKEDVAKAKSGVASPVGLLRAKHLEVLGGGGPKTRLNVVLDEGKNREIRRLFATFKDPKTGRSLKVMELKRISIGGLKVDVPPGHWRFLEPSEETKLAK